MIEVIIFIIGLCVGSFLNVVIDRPLQKRSIVSGRSSCDFCHHVLAWFDLLPVLSYIFLLGKCRYCHKKLSIQYPLVELLTALSFIVAFVFLPHETLFDLFHILSVFGLLTSGIALLVTDIKYQLLPNGLMIAFAFFSVLFVMPQSSNTFLFRLLVATLSCIPFICIYFVSKGRAMGFGDVKLSFLMGFLLSFPSIVPAFYVAFLTGAVVGIILILGRKVRFHGGTIAFGPFLLFGTFIGAIWGINLWNYIRGIVGF